MYLVSPIRTYIITKIQMKYRIFYLLVQSRIVQSLCHIAEQIIVIIHQATNRLIAILNLPILQIKCGDVSMDHEMLHREPYILFP